MADIESRIAELFNERLQKGKTVVTMEDVELSSTSWATPTNLKMGISMNPQNLPGLTKISVKDPGGNYTVMEKMPFWVVLLPVWLPIWAGM